MGQVHTITLSWLESLLLVSKVILSPVRLVELLLGETTWRKLMIILLLVTHSQSCYSPLPPSDRTHSRVGSLHSRSNSYNNLGKDNTISENPSITIPVNLFITLGNLYMLYTFLWKLSVAIPQAVEDLLLPGGTTCSPSQ
jgi:hypothetical protein